MLRDVCRMHFVALCTYLSISQVLMLMFIKEVFRTLMSGPRMVVSRGKKSFDRDEAPEDERPIVLVPSEVLRQNDDDSRQYDGAMSSDMVVNPVELQQQPRLGSVVWMLHHKQSSENAY